MNDVANLLTLNKMRGLNQQNIKTFYTPNMSDERIITKLNAPQFIEMKQNTLMEMEVMERYGIKAITYLDKNMSGVTTAPLVLFYKGNIDLLNPMIFKVAVIGTRECTPIIEQKERLMVDIIAQSAVTVSGLALGCDAVAHHETIRCGGKTIAILPSAIQGIKPAQNTGLAQDIVASGGLLISEYLTNSTNTFEIKHRYVERDRLQALFSNGIMLCASKEGGGSRIALNHGYLLKKPICALTFNDIQTNPMLAINRKVITQYANGAINTPEDMTRWLSTTYKVFTGEQMRLF